MHYYFPLSSNAHDREHLRKVEEMSEDHSSAGEVSVKKATRVGSSEPDTRHGRLFSCLAEHFIKHRIKQFFADLCRELLDNFHGDLKLFC